MRALRTHYDNLQIQEGAGPEVIKASYKALAQKWHPDRNQDNPDEAERIFKIITSAFEVLSDSETRAKYDAWLVEQRKGSTPPPVAQYASPQPAKPERRPYDTRGNVWTPHKPDQASTGTNGSSSHRTPQQSHVHLPEQGFKPFRVLVIVVLVTAWFLVFGNQWTIETVIGNLFSR